MVNAQILPLFFRQSKPTQAPPKTYTREELKRKLVEEIVLIEGDKNAQGKYDGMYYDQVQKKRVTANITDLRTGIAEAKKSNFGDALANYLTNLLNQVNDELRLLKDLYKNIDKLSEKEIDAKIGAISKRMNLIISSIDIAIKELESLKSIANKNPFSDKAEELQVKINQMKKKKAYLQQKLAEMNSIIKATIVQPPPPPKLIKDQIKEQEELFNRLLEQIRPQTAGAVFNILDEPSVWQRWFGSGQKNKPEDEQMLAKWKLINSQLKDLIDKRLLTDEDRQKLKDSKTLEERIKIIVDIQDRQRKPPESPEPPIVVRPTSNPALLEKLLREKYGNEVYNRKIFASEVYYDEAGKLIIKTPSEIEIAHREAQKDLIRQMPFGHERLAMERAYQELYSQATSIVPKSATQPFQLKSPKPEVKKPEKPKLKITYYINPNDTFKYKSKLEELVEKGEIEFQAFKNINVSSNGTVWYIKGYSPEQVKDWVENNIMNE